jgi:hypothetical protein
MNGASWRLLGGPVVLAALGLALFAAVPLVVAYMHLSAKGVAALALHHGAGIWMWLALAWLAARVIELLLRRVAMVSRDGTPYPRLLSDLLRATLFAAALVLILLLVFDQPATDLITVSSVVIAVVGFALRNCWHGCGCCSVFETWRGGLSFGARTAIPIDQARSRHPCAVILRVAATPALGLVSRVTTPALGLVSRVTAPPTLWAMPVPCRCDLTAM